MNKKEYHVTCGYCEGFGYDPKEADSSCPACGGTGQVKLVYEDGKNGRIRVRVK